jgi:hypothetical protein
MGREQSSSGRVTCRQETLGLILNTEKKRLTSLTNVVFIDQREREKEKQGKTETERITPKLYIRFIFKIIKMYL